MHIYIPRERERLVTVYSCRSFYAEKSLQHIQLNPQFLLNLTRTISNLGRARLPGTLPETM